jgi:tetratricopeptide (TPR) repeat protein
MKLFCKLFIIILLAATAFALHPVQAKEMELPDSVHERITQFSKDGDVLAQQGKYREAVDKYLQAFELLPEPRTDWEACTWLLAAIGDANFRSKNYEQATRSSIFAWARRSSNSAICRERMMS